MELSADLMHVHVQPSIHSTVNYVACLRVFIRCDGNIRQSQPLVRTLGSHTNHTIHAFPGIRDKQQPDLNPMPESFL